MRILEALFAHAQAAVDLEYNDNLPLRFNCVSFDTALDVSQSPDGADILVSVWDASSPEHQRQPSQAFVDYVMSNIESWAEAAKLGTEYKFALHPDISPVIPAKEGPI